MNKSDYVITLLEYDILPDNWRKMSKEELVNYFNNIDKTELDNIIRKKKALERKILMSPEKGKKLLLNKIDYKSLNSTQKANYNFQKISGSLAEYGFNCVKLDNLWEGANIIATHIDSKQILRIRHKGRFTVDHKYRDKNLFIFYVENGLNKLYYHDDAYKFAKHGEANLTWKERGQNYIKTPKRYEPIIYIL